MLEGKEMFSVLIVSDVEKRNSLNILLFVGDEVCRLSAAGCVYA